MLRRLLRGVAQTVRGAPQETERNGRRSDLEVDAICDFCAHRYRWHGRTCTHDTVQLRGDCPCPGFKPSGFRSIAWPGLLLRRSCRKSCAPRVSTATPSTISSWRSPAYGGRRSLLEGNPMSCHYDDPSLTSGCE